MAAHAALKRELLVRYLDAWTPAALHGARQASYVEGYAGPGDSAMAALRVFGEFADLLAKHPMAMVLVGRNANRLDALQQRLAESAPAGLTVRTGTGPLLAEVKSLRGPMFAYLNSCGSTPPDPGVLAAIGSTRGSELLIALDEPAAGCRSALAALGHFAEVELVDADGKAQTLLFASASARNLEKFKDELWALDEYAGIRYREPHDPEHALLDISLKPHLGPLRRALLAYLTDRGERTVGQLREYAAAETIYRAADTAGAVTALAAAGAVVRTPKAGRLTADTLIQAV